MMICEGCNLKARSELNNIEDEERTLSRPVTASAIGFLREASCPCISV